MDNNIIKNYKQVIEESENALLEHYKNLVDEYETSENAYEGLISEYENILNDDELEGTTPVVLPCSQIYGYNRAGVVTRWGLYDLEGRELFVSDRHPKNEVYTLNLTTLYLIPNTQMRLKAIVSAGADCSSNEIIEYVPDSKQSAYYKLTGTAFHTSLTFETFIPNDL